VLPRPCSWRRQPCKPRFGDPPALSRQRGPESGRAWLLRPGKGSGWATAAPFLSPFWLGGAQRAWPVTVRAEQAPAQLRRGVPWPLPPCVALRCERHPRRPGPTRAVGRQLSRLRPRKPLRVSPGAVGAHSAPAGVGEGFESSFGSTVPPHLSLSPRCSAAAEPRTRSGPCAPSPGGLLGFLATSMFKPDVVYLF